MRCSWLSACVLSLCAQQPPRSSSTDCHGTLDVAACEALPEIRGCLHAARDRRPDTTRLCEQVWQRQNTEAAAVAGAYYALNAGDDAALMRWNVRALDTAQGARIFHFVGEMQQRHGNFRDAKDSFRRALTLQIDGDPGRAANTALWLLGLVRSSEPAEESIRLARLAWEQAELARNELMRACTAISLVEILIELGELPTAAAVIDRMDAGDQPSWREVRDFASARLEAAQGRIATAIALFRRASRLDPATQAGLPYDAIELVPALLDDGQVAEARRELGRARELVRRRVVDSDDIEAQLAAAEASVELAEGHVDAALASTDRGLALTSRDAARVRLLNVRGDVLAVRGDAPAAEQAWRQAADTVEAWRASIPTTQLRSRLVSRHRRALESWLESTGQRHDAEGALEVTQRIIGRELLDRIYQRESNAPVTADASIRDLEHRLEVRRELSVTMAGAHGRDDLRDVRHDMVAIMFGSRSVWAIRRARSRWSIDRVGDRNSVRRWVDAYRRNIDDPGIAAILGEALFPAATLPAPGAPLVVMLDRELSDVALAGLRVGGKYLVERGPILEVLAPALVLAEVPKGPWGPSVGIGDPQHNLEAAVDEVAAMARQTRASTHLGAGAMRAVIEASSRAFVLHVATHSKIEDGRAAFVLSDGALSSNEIVSGRIAPRLAVIATCRSQVDDDPATSLVAAFLAAGSPAVIGVKRALDDKDGAALMREFYRLHGAEEPLRALALAQRAAIAADQPPHAWATVSFFGVGGWIEH